MQGVTWALSALLAGAAAAAPAPSPMQKSGALFELKCAKCHTIGGGRRVGPDLRGLAMRRTPEWALGFIMRPGAALDSDPVAMALLKEFNGVRMEETHLSRPEAEGILSYIETAGAAPLPSPGRGLAPEEPLAAKVRMPEEGLSVSMPGLALMLSLLCAAAAAWRFGWPAAWGLLLIGGAVSGYWAFGGRRHHHLLGNEQGYSPVQPIAYSHARHAGELQIACLYCHYGAEKGDVAGVPPLSVCMNCHKDVRRAKGAKTPSPDIARLVAAWEGRQSSAPAVIEWVRVHNLPDFVHFSHRAHVANNIQCRECHGPVETMERMRQAASLSMGWCLSCHRQEKGEAPAHWKRSKGPSDCTACHQ